MLKKGQIVAVIVIALVLSVTTYAFASANSLPVTAAGDGSNSISGYAISNVHYTLDSSNTNITDVSFHAVPATKPDANPSFKLAISDGTTAAWSSSCTPTFAADGSADVSCSGSFGTVYDATTLRVVANN